MTEPDGGSTVRAVLSGSEWRVGYCRAGSQRGAYVFLWPLRGAAWDLAFHPRATFDSDSAEEVYFIATDDEAAILELERAQIEWAPGLAVAESAALDYFPETRVAEAVRRARGIAAKRGSLTPKSVDPASIAEDPWNWSEPSDSGISSVSFMAEAFSSRRTRMMKAVALACFICAGVVGVVSIVLVGYSIVAPGVTAGAVSSMVMAGMVLRYRSDPAYDYRNRRP